MQVGDDWKSPGMGQSNPHFLKKILKNIEEAKKYISPEDDILDVGCYQGHMYEHLGHEKYTGMDLYEANAAKARSIHPGVDFFCGDLFDLKGSWDVILCSRVLMHLPDFEVAIDRLRSCVRKHLIVFIPVGPDFVNVETHCGHKVYFRSFSKETVLETGGIIYKNEPYSTVIYGPRLP